MIESIESFIQSEFGAAVDCLQQTAHMCENDISFAARLIIEAIRSGHKMLLCGNGGSASLCQHLASELVNGLNLITPALPAIALTTDVSTLTAIANDYGYKHIFEHQVEALGQAGDILLAVSTSGNSKSVVRAARVAERKKMTVISITSDLGGELFSTTRIAIRVPDWGTQHIQEAHLAIGHILVALIEHNLCEAEAGEV